MSSHVLAPFLSCLGLSLKSRRQQSNCISTRASVATDEPRYTDKDTSRLDFETASTNFVDVLLAAPSSDLPILYQKLTHTIVGYSWTESLAKAILTKLEAVLSDPSKLGGALKDAFERAVSEAVGFARDHPAYCMLIALGILVVIGAPWILEMVGFAELGPVEGSFAALWQARYAGYVPRGSLFSYLQRLGMVWKTLIEAYHKD